MVNTFNSDFSVFKTKHDKICQVGLFMIVKRQTMHTNKLESDEKKISK